MKTPAPVILILTSGPLCRNPRVHKEAEALGSAGYDVTVMTVANIGRFEAYDREILRTAPFRKVALDHLSRRGFPGAASFASRLATWIARRGARLGLQSGQALGPAAALGRMARGFQADLTIVHTEMPFCIGTALMSRGRRVAADFEDWHSRDLLPGAQSFRPVALIRRAERGLMLGSSYASTTSQAMAAALHAEFGGAPPVVITNSFPLAPDLPARSRDRPPSIIWFSQTIGPGRGLEQFLAAWRMTTVPSELTLLGDVDQSYREKLVGRLPPDRRSRLGFKPVMSPAELSLEIARHDIGLALELTFPMSKDCTISNKILQYLNAGLAVLGTGTAGQREVLAHAPGAGLIIDPSQTGDLAALLDSLIGDRPRLEAMGRAARQAAADTYCWERESPRLLGAVERALSAPPPRRP
jgi:glycosyltransferase involved in cell wall biosynthesis